MAQHICEHCDTSFHSPGNRPRRFCSHHCYTQSRIKTPESIWNRIDRSAGPDSCWIWTGTTNGLGYGNLTMGSKSQRPHRIAWELVNGPIPEGMVICHNCPDGDNPSCCNPSHFFLGTKADNSADMAKKGRSPRGEKQPSTALTEDDVRRIRSMFDSGQSCADISTTLKMKRGTVWAIARRKTWKHVV